jgi:pimeloyl-ACP methyl ester carboxylesterase
MRRSLTVVVALAVTVASPACVTHADRNPLERADATTTTAARGSSTSTARGSSTSTTPGIPTFRPDPIEWHDCAAGECAIVRVPLDYAMPNGTRIGIGVFRSPAYGRRIGALAVNPGGPGAPALNAARGAAGSMPASITEHFDIVGIDPRGIGSSAAIDCGNDYTKVYGVDYSLDDAADRQRLLDVSQGLIRGCQASDGEMLPHMGTREVARDMDAVRAAMSDDQLTFVGFSYGTAIGQVYADLFPSRVRAMVLDGVVELGVDGLTGAATQARGFETALAAFAADCDRRSSCPLRPDAMARIDDLQAKAETGIAAPDADRRFGPGEYGTGVAVSLYAKSRWPALADAVDAALHGDGSQMVALADEYLGLGGGISFDVYFATGCLDSEWPENADTVFAAAKAEATRSPHFAEPIINDYVRCALWPIDESPLEATTAPGTPPILVVSTTRDPATPYESGVHVAKTLAHGVLLTHDGDGHVAFGHGNSCIDAKVTNYLVDLTPPENGTEC